MACFPHWLIFIEKASRLRTGSAGDRMEGERLSAGGLLGQAAHGVDVGKPVGSLPAPARPMEGVCTFGTLEVSWLLFPTMRTGLPGA